MSQTPVSLHIFSPFTVVGKAHGSHLDLLPAESGRCARQKACYKILALLVSSQIPVPLLKLEVAGEGLWDVL